MIRRSALVLLLASAIAPAIAAPLLAQLPDTLSSTGRIYVLTTLPGDLVYSRYGHTAIRVHDPTQGMDVTFNYGTFDFEAPGFLARFIKGETDYFLSFSSTLRAVQGARIQGRTVRQQLLDVNAEHRDRIYRALLRNSLPENRTYRYDFLFDNCATRPLDIILGALGNDAILDSTATGLTFRELLDPYHADAPELDLGTDLIMGSVIDRPATSREEAFLPLRLEAILNAAEVEDQYGRRPLVSVQDTVMLATRPEMPSGSFPWPMIGTSLLLLLGGFALRWKPSGNVATGDLVLLGVLGLAGVILGYMATGTAHYVTTANYNILWALPTHLVAALLINRLSPRVAGYYLSAAVALAGLSLLGGLLLPQPVPVAMVPVILLAMVRFGWAARRLLGPAVSNAA